MIRNVFHLCQIGFFYTLRPLIGRLSNRYVWLLACFVGNILFLIKRGRRQRAGKEIQLISGLNSISDMDVIQRGFQLFVYNNFLTYCYHRINPISVNDWIEVDNCLSLSESLSKGRGIIIILMHFGANQMAMPALGHRGFQIHQIGSRPEDWFRLTGVTPSMFEKKLAELRFRAEAFLPAKFLYIDKSMVPVVTLLRQNQILMMAADGRAGLKFFRVPVMKRTMLISQGPFRLAASTGAALIPAFTVFDHKTHRYCLKIESEIERNPDLAQANQTQEMAQQYATRVSDRLTKHLDHYCILMAEARLRAAHDAFPLFEDYNETVKPRA